ncbi:hypothetical protein TNCV_3950941 [Trichonephila clavipes]|nr:hypothetical protein TNCV_3950941 [Trichonephila clavipes]
MDSCNFGFKKANLLFGQDYGISADWKYTRSYNPQRRLRVVVEKCRKDSSHSVREINHYDRGGPDFLVMDGNIELIWSTNFSKNEDIRQMRILASYISRPHPYRTCMGCSREGY